MADRRMIRLSQLPERLAREKLEDSDWVTFAVVVNKTTQKSNSSVGASMRRRGATLVPLPTSAPWILGVSRALSCRGRPSASGS